MSQTGKAEPITYEALLDVATVPDEMRQMTLKFVADDTVLKSQTFDYGDSFDADIYPEIPEKDGYYGAWDVTELDDLHFDTTVTAIYTRYVTTVPSEVSRDSGRPVFFVDGSYDDDAQFTAQAMAQTNSGLSPVSAGLSDADRALYVGQSVVYLVLRADYERGRRAVGDHDSVGRRFDAYGALSLSE